METLALAIDAPVRSVISPERVAPATCASDRADHPKFRQRASTTQVIKPIAAFIPFCIVIRLLVSWLGSFTCLASQNELCRERVRNPHLRSEPKPWTKEALL